MPQYNVGDRVVSSVNTQGLVRDVATYEVVDVAANHTPFGVYVTYRVTRIDRPDGRMIDVGNGHLVLRSAPGPCATASQVTREEAAARMGSRPNPTALESWSDDAGTDHWLDPVSGELIEKEGF